MWDTWAGTCPTRPAAELGRAGLAARRPDSETRRSNSATPKARRGTGFRASGPPPLAVSSSSAYSREVGDLVASSAPERSPAIQIGARCHIPTAPGAQSSLPRRGSRETTSARRSVTSKSWVCLDDQPVSRPGPLRSTRRGSVAPRRAAGEEGRGRTGAVSSSPTAFVSGHLAEGSFDTPPEAISGFTVFDVAGLPAAAVYSRSCASRCRARRRVDSGVGRGLRTPTGRLVAGFSVIRQLSRRRHP
jgi:hypothetical protein